MSTYYKLLAIKTAEGANIGDYIQALAASQFLPHVDGFVDREHLKSYDGDVCKVVMNGWFMHNPEQWPPSDNIIPLFVASHINSLAHKQMLSEEGIRYLKAHEPIGCRDTNTRDLLLAKGVKAYFSGCLTLTLGQKYSCQGQRSDTVCFVDPYFITHWNVINTCVNAVYLLFHWRAINTIAKKHPEPKKGLRKRMILVNFFRQYRRIFSDEVLLKATYICQQDRHYIEEFPTDEALLAEAERLVKLYARARLVVTSRIHCALPCLGLGTPVIYTENSYQTEASKCRFGGLRELFNILRWEQGALKPEFSLKGMISSEENIPENKKSWEPIASKLKNTMKSWLES